MHLCLYLTPMIGYGLGPSIYALLSVLFSCLLFYIYEEILGISKLSLGIRMRTHKDKVRLSM
jgi:hypothetical protein